MQLEQTIDFAFDVLAEKKQFAPQLVIERKNGEVIVLLLLWEDDESKRGMVNAAALFAGGLDAQKIELITDVWYAQDDLDDPRPGDPGFVLPRNRENKREAIIVLEVWQDRHHETIVPYRRENGSIVREEPVVSVGDRYDGWMLDTLRYGLQVVTSQDLARKAGEYLGIDVDEVFGEEE